MECHGYNINPNAQWTAMGSILISCYKRRSLPLMNPNALWAVGNYFIGL